MINHLVHQRYEVLEKIGESPLFVVYKARDKVSSRVLALKTVQAAYNADPVYLAALQSGLTAASSLSHPNIARFEEWGEEDGQSFALAEFVRGINLKERIRRIAPFTLSVAVDFACAIAEALHYAHSLGQMHGDLRPQNIIISPEGTLKVTDFGVQPAIARSPQAQLDTLRLSAPYHAPELSTKQAGTAGGDIYALGAILYEMLTGTPPYAGDTPEAIADQHAFAPIPSPRAINPGVPRSVEGIALKCLQKRPELRYRAAADLLNDLKAVRDALRFGKPLSWSPTIETDVAPVAPPASGAKAAPVRPPEPVASVAAASYPVTDAMTAKNRLREESERVSIYIKVAIAAVTALILVCMIGLAGLWMSNFGLPKPVPAPQIVGKPIAEVRQVAMRVKARLIEHAEYTDKPKDIVYKADLERNAPIRPNHAINVWYSKGPAYVNVPNVANLVKEEAEQRLKDAGLTVGAVTTEYSDRVATNLVVRQNVSYKKRVFHDTAVDLVISDGPKPEYASSDNGGNSGDLPPTDPNAADNTSNGDNSAATDAGSVDANSANPVDTPAPEPDRTFDRSIDIPRDGMGVRQVKIVYKDAQGWHDQVPVIDEPHNEGERIPISFSYQGRKITLRIYYNNVMKWEKRFDPQKTLKERVQ